MYPQQFNYNNLYQGASPMITPGLFNNFNPYNDLFSGFQTKLDDLFKNYQTQLNANAVQQQSIASENATAPALTKKPTNAQNKQTATTGVVKAPAAKPNVQYGGSRPRPAQGITPAVMPGQPNAQIGSLFGSTGTGVAKNPNSPMMNPRFR